MTDTTTTEPTITHPAWCDPEHCFEDTSDGVLMQVSHGTDRDVWRAADLNFGWLHRPSDATASVHLTRIDDYAGEPDEPTVAFVETSGDDPLTIDDLESLSAWLTAKAAAVREAVTTEGGAR